VTASESIKVRQEGGRSPGVYGLDGALFLVRHLWVLKEVVVSFELGSGDSGGGGRADVRERDESVTGELSVCISKLVYFIYFCWYLDTLANFLSRTSGLLPLPEGFFGTLGVGVGGQGERGELRYVCFLFVVVLVFLGGLLFEGTDPSSLPPSLCDWCRV